MLKVLLVDDEDIIIQGLRVLTDWGALGFAVVGEAYDGEEALEAAAALRPDIIITDIRMPVVDGLSMIDKARAFLPTALFIILSGYDDFSYAQQALDKGAFAYLLKPVTAQTLEQKLNEAKQSIAERRRKEEQLHKLYHMRSPARDAYFSRLVQQRGITPGEIEEAWVLFELEGPPGAAAAVFFDFPAKGDAVLKFAVDNVLDEIVTQRQMGFCFDYAAKYSVVLACGADRPSLGQALPALCEEICGTVERLLGIRLSVGVGGIGDAEDVSESVRQGLLALSRDFLEKGRIYYYDSLNERPPLPADAERLSAALFDSVEARDAEGCRRALDALNAAFREARPERQAIIAAYREMFASLKRRLVNTFPELREDAAVAGTVRIVWNAFDDYAALHAHCAEAVERLASVLQAHTVSQSAQLVGKIKEYIQSHYEEANRDDVAKRFYINPSYLSQVFKQVEGCGFSEYLTGVRVQRAKHLLVTTDYKVQLIAEKLGYTSSQHFSRVFKKVTGVLPFDYRRVNRKPT